MTKARRKRHQRGKPEPEGAAAIIDRHLLQMIPMSIDGKPNRVTVPAAIVFQLFLKELAGDVKASRVLLKYQQITKRIVDKTIQLTFAENDDALPEGREMTEDGNG